MHNAAPGAKVALFANTEWYLYNFRLPLARRLKDLGYEVLLLSPPGPYGQRLRELGFDWRPVPLRRRSLNPLAELAFLLRLARLLRTERPSLIHNFTLKCAIYGSLAGRLAGVQRRINAVAGLGYVFSSSDARARVLRPLVRALIQLALLGRWSRVVLQNSDDFAVFERTGLARRADIRLIRGSGVDCSRFTPPPERRDADRLRVLLAARILIDKGVLEFVEAARALRAPERRIEFLLAGEPDEGNPAAIASSVIRGWVDEGLIQWLGHVEDMPTLVRSVDVVVLPSYREGLPKSLIEAAACARPLVTTDVPGCREVVEDGVDGLLVPPRTVQPLAEAIARLHDDPELRRRLGKGARAKALSQFDQEIVLAKTVAVYEELLNRT
ncbi:MAG: glycosyltransferase family 4 protein [Proteobacteria bacterium]|nr:glycosyltransferase family 4 protein [Pseudomonadota bacterium]